jgi:hypothetical protein
MHDAGILLNMSYNVHFMAWPNGGSIVLLHEIGHVKGRSKLASRLLKKQLYHNCVTQHLAGSRQA